MVHLDYRDSRPIYAQICESLRSQIKAGVLAPGDRLPSVRELAAELTINPNTIQRAYRELETQGLIASVPVKGRFICAIPHSSPTARSAWDALDEAVRQLAAMGVDTEAVIRHLKQGGDQNA